MHMEQIEVFRLAHLHHLHREGERIRRVVKKRVAGNLHLVKLDALVRIGQPNGGRIADEVNFVPARRQFHPQFSGNYTRAAVSRVASDTNLHVQSSVVLACSSIIRIAGKSIDDAVTESKSTKPGPEQNDDSAAHYQAQDRITYFRTRPRPTPASLGLDVSGGNPVS